MIGFPEPRPDTRYGHEAASDVRSLIVIGNSGRLHGHPVPGLAAGVKPVTGCGQVTGAPRLFRLSRSRAHRTSLDAGIGDDDQVKLSPVGGNPKATMPSGTGHSEAGKAPEVEIRPSATVIIVRASGAFPSVLMGQRSRSAVFMPSKFVFPGGAVDPSDRLVSLSWHGYDPSLDKLGLEAGDLEPGAIVLAGIREVWEETGLKLAVREVETNSQGFGVNLHNPSGGPIPACWAEFFGQAVVPSAAGMKFIFRAITPPGRPHRFDARFLMVDAGHVLNDLDDFSQGSGELSHLSWVPLHEATSLELPFITEVVLAELEEILSKGATGRGIPFFHHQDVRSCVSHL